MKQFFKICLFLVGGILSLSLLFLGLGIIHFDTEDKATLILTNETTNESTEIPVDVIILEDGTKIYKIGSVVIKPNEIETINKTIN